MTDSDRSIINLLQSDRNRGLQVVMKEHNQFLLRLAYRVLGSEDDAHDAVQQAYIRIFYGKWQFKGQSSIKTYYASIVINICRDILRTMKRRDTLINEWTQEAESCDAAQDEDASQHEIVRSALCQIPVQFRIPLQLCEWEDMKYGEIASVLNIPINTVRSRIARGRRKLSELLTAAGVNI